MSVTQERLYTLLVLNDKDFDYSTIAMYPLHQLMNAAVSLNEWEVQSAWYAFNKNIMQQLIEHPETKDIFADLSQRGVCGNSVNSLLGQMKHAGKSIADYPVEQISATLLTEELHEDFYLDFLDHFVARELPDNQLSTLLQNLNKKFNRELVDMNDLSEAEKSVLLEPYFNTNLVPNIGLREAIAHLAEQEDLRVIMNLYMLHAIEASFAINAYRDIAEQAAPIREALEQVLLVLQEAEAMRQFTERWTENRCSLNDLHVFLRKASCADRKELLEIVQTRSGYINFLYGNVLSIKLVTELRFYYEELVLYLISHRKHQFMKLMEENLELFNEISRNSILFCPQFYAVNVNLNTLGLKDLKALKKMPCDRYTWDVDILGSHPYTFQEVKALYGFPEQYATFYRMLDIPRIDDKLIVFRQLTKRLLLDGVLEEDLAPLALCLQEKPLAQWMNTDFVHIRHLTPQTAIKLLIHLSEIPPGILATLHTNEDIELVVRNRNHLEEISSLESLQCQLLDFDESWLKLAGKLQLTRDFAKDHMDDILQFIQRDGTSICLTYMESLTRSQKEAFIRIIKAQLSGKFNLLKYHPDDLQSEISFPIDEGVQRLWADCLSTKYGSIAVLERDDFFSTMQMGEQPIHTCMSYLNGAQRECLLSGFDTNKKIIQAISEDGKVVGRAIIRLTKGRFGSADEQVIDEDDDGPSLEFYDVDTETEQSALSRERNDNLILFLERPYTAYLSPEQERDVLHRFLQLAEKKARKLGCMLVVSILYGDVVGKQYTMTNFNVYISRSKAGKQYMDSLGGSAHVSCEKGYRRNRFLIHNSMLV